MGVVSSRMLFVSRFVVLVVGVCIVLGRVVGGWVLLLVKYYFNRYFVS